MRLGRSTTTIAFGYGSAWIGAYDDSGSWLAIISAGSTKPEWIRLVRGESCGPPYDPGPYGAPLVATGAGGVWVLTCGQRPCNSYQIDPETHRIVGRIANFSLDPASFLAVGAGAVWLAGDSVWEIDPVTTSSCARFRWAAERRHRAESPLHKTPSGSPSAIVLDTIGE